VKFAVEYESAGLVHYPEGEDNPRQLSRDSGGATEFLHDGTFITLLGICAVLESEIEITRVNNVAQVAES